MTGVFRPEKGFVISQNNDKSIKFPTHKND